MNADSKSQQRVEIVIDLGYLKDDPALPNSTPLFQILECTADPFDTLREVLFQINHQKGLVGFHPGREFSHVSVSVLPRNLDKHTYNPSTMSGAQPIRFAYGSFGELRMLGSPQSDPAELTFGQIKEVVVKHYQQFDATRIVVRYEGGFGSTGSSLIELLTAWMIEISASRLIDFFVGQGWSLLSNRLPWQARLSREQEFAQISRDLVSRNVTSARDLRHWLDSKQNWRLKEIVEALVMPRGLAAQFLRDAGYVPRAFSTKWELGRNAKAQRKRERWVFEERKGFGWTRLP